MCGYLENDPVVSHSEFPITFQCSLQRLSKDFRLFSKALFDRSSYDNPISGIDRRKINFIDVRMIN